MKISFLFLGALFLLQFVIRNVEANCQLPPQGALTSPCGSLVTGPVYLPQGKTWSELDIQYYGFYGLGVDQCILNTQGQTFWTNYICSVIFPRCDASTGKPLPPCVDTCLSILLNSQNRECKGKVDYCVNDGINHSLQPTCTDWASYTGGNYSVPNWTPTVPPPFSSTCPSQFRFGDSKASIPYSFPSSTISSAFGGSSYTITVRGIRELNVNGSLIRELGFDKIGWSYFCGPNELTFETSNFFGLSNTKFNFTYFFIDTELFSTNAGQNVTYLPGTMKFTFNLEHWPFLDPSNYLVVPITISLSDPLKNLTANKDPIWLSGSLLTTTNTTLLYNFLRISIIDDVPTLTEGNPTSSLVDFLKFALSFTTGINFAPIYSVDHVVVFPSFQNVLHYDPDFRVLVGGDESTTESATGSQSAGVTGNTRKGLSTGAIAGIIFAVVVVVVVVVILIMLKKSVDKRKSLQATLTTTSSS